MSWAIVNPETNSVVKVVRDGVQFTHGDVQFPSNWLVTATVEERVARNIRPLDEAPYPDTTLVNALYQEYVVHPDRVVATWVTQPKPTEDVARELVNAKEAAKRAVDGQAEGTRNQFVTPGAGQAMTYQEKAAQAAALKADASPSALKYPMIYAEVGITGADAEAVADVILANHLSWKQLGAGIEQIRLTAKTAIDAAASKTAVDAIVNAIVWPKP